MESEGGRTVWILRRMKRESTGRWAWSVYNPFEARPEELRFDLLDERERNIGEITYHKSGTARMNFLKGVELTTPWGGAMIEVSKGGVQISLNNKELVRLNLSRLRGEADFIFQDGVVMRFNRIKGRRNDLEFSDGKGSVSFSEEVGTLLQGQSGLKVQMTKEEIKSLPKGDRPRSVETRDYVQYRITVQGALPLRKEDLLAALTIFASSGRLMDEIPTF